MTGRLHLHMVSAAMLSAGLLAGGCGGASPASPPPASPVPSATALPSTPGTATQSATALASPPGSAAAPTASAVPPTVGPTVRLATISDGAGDLFDNDGRPAAGPAYLDIVRAELQLVGTNYVLRMTLAGPVPSKLDDPNIAIEWDFYLDTDQRAATGWAYPQIDNDIGADFQAYVYLRGSKLDVGVSDVVANTFTPITGVKISGSLVEVSFPWDLVKRAAQLDAVVAARQWQFTTATSSRLAFADKAPDSGHLTLR